MFLCLISLPVSIYSNDLASIKTMLWIIFLFVVVWLLKWSRSVMSDSLWPVDCSPPSSSIHGILQAIIREWVGISFSRGSSWPRDRTQVSHIAGRCFNLCTTREALKYKNTVSQKTSYRDTELQIQVLTSKISREERKPGWKKKGEEAGEGGAKGVALQTSPATYRYPGVMGLCPGPPEKGELELGPTRNQTRSEPEFKFSAKRRWSVSNPQLRLRSLDLVARAEKQSHRNELNPPRLPFSASSVSSNLIKCQVMCWVSQEFQEKVRQIVCPDFVIFARTRNRRGGHRAASRVPFT